MVRVPKSNRAKTSKETHQALKQFVSDVSVSLLHHIHSQLGDGFSVDGVEISVDDVKGDHRTNKNTLCFSRSYSVGCIAPPFRTSFIFYSLVVHSVYLVHANKCVNFLLTNNVSAWLPRCAVFISNFAEMFYQGGHVERVPGRYSDPDEPKTLIEH